MTKPGDFSCPQLRPFVKILETITIFFTLPAFLAASISLIVPTLSTSWAAAFILSGFPGMNPVAITNDSAPAMLAARSSTESLTTSNRFRATAEVSTEATFWTMAPRTTVDDSSREVAALSTLRTPPMTSRFPADASRSKTRRPVWPVAPATTTLGTEGAAASSAKAICGAEPTTAAEVIATPATNRVAWTKASRRPTTFSWLSFETKSAEEEALLRKDDGANASVGVATTAATRIKLRSIIVSISLGFFFSL
mmetsp:Transcript_23074/g.49129  ORF Transcript_23074/g.49129 Transcript_23074/m.49129 type:complete len:253 (-) Transcript_23074:82-840(-)